MLMRYHKTGTKKLHLVFTGLLLLLFSLLSASEAQFRGIVIRGSDWAYEPDREARESLLREMIVKASEHGYNSVLFEIRKAAEVFYPSPYETWSFLLGENGPGFDPLKLVIEETKKQGMQLIVQMDVLSAYNLITKPHSAKHLAQRNEQWLLKDDRSQPIAEDVYYYLDPSNPEVLTHLKKIVQDITDRYQIDGFYFSGLKYPNNQVLESSRFKENYEAIRTFSEKSAEDYARDLISNCLEMMVSQIKLRKPYLLIFAESEALPYEIKGIPDLKPADTYYFQDGLQWLDEKLIDVLVPRIFIKARRFDELYKAYHKDEEGKGAILPLLQGNQNIYSDPDVRKTLQIIEKNEGLGAFVYSAPDVMKNKTLFKTSADLPYLSRTHRQTHAIEIDLQHVDIPLGIVKTNGDGRIRILDKDHCLSLMLPDLPRTLQLKTMKRKLRYSTREWKVPYRYKAVSGNELQRPDLYIELRKAPGLFYPDSAFQFLFRASAGDTRINGEKIEAYPYTGIFFKWVRLNDYGKPTLVRGSVYGDADSLYYEELYYGNVPDTSKAEALIMESVSPQGSVLLPPGDKLRISFRSDLAAQMDTILLYAGRKSFPLWYNGNQYIGEIPTSPYISADTVFMKVAAKDNAGKSYFYDLPLSLKVLDREAFPLIETAEDFVPFSYSLGLVRLGGPYLNEYPRGVRFVTDGKFGSDLRVRLNSTEVAFVNERYVKVLPPEYPKPEYNITSISVQADTFAERIIIPWPEPVPYAIFPEPELKRIRVRLYGVHSNSTWITHRSSLELVDYVTWQQHDAETYDVLVYLKDSNIWGYDLKQNERWLSVEIRRPPSPDSILVALEAGHGGDWNWGALGLSGMKEKDVNLDVTEKTRDLLLDMGYRVAEIRPGDSAPYLRERWLLTDSLQADIFVSIHANAAGGDYLRVAGTSTYYNNPFWRDFAGLTYGNMLELPLDEFGIVGSFNYMMCRMRQRPSILVELAFMSHADDENKMANPDFRTAMAGKIAKSIDEYIRQKLSSGKK